VESVDTPNVIVRQPTFFDILVEHDPPGTLPGENTDDVLRIQCWVKRIAAHYPEEAALKAERFLAETRGVRNTRVKRWRYSSRSQQKGVKPDGTLFT
jgi:hypothetical protein